ncbi:hypothetical protein [Streptomyces sp. NPDC088178]|uniref:hypothetical protein n=1 Tax=Streptomyces sp. NPDC088178 TaxID=3365836 RepID=UPI0038241B63
MGVVHAHQYRPGRYESVRQRQQGGLHLRVVRPAGLSSGTQDGTRHLAVCGGQAGQLVQDRRQQLLQTGTGVPMVRGPALRGQHEHAVACGQQESRPGATARAAIAADAFRAVSFDGCSSIKVPDTAPNLAWCGTSGHVGYPMAELMTLVAGTRALIGAVFGTTRKGETACARRPLHRVADDADHACAPRGRLGVSTEHDE